MEDKRALEFAKEAIKEKVTKQTSKEIIIKDNLRGYINKNLEDNPYGALLSSSNRDLAAEHIIDNISDILNKLQADNHTPLTSQERMGLANQIRSGDISSLLYGTKRNTTNKKETNHVQSIKSTSYINLNISGSDFTITKAVVKENLEEIFIAECEGYCESFENPLLHSLNNFSNKNSASGYNFLDQFATLTLKKITFQSDNSRSSSVNFQENNNSNESIYKGIISQVNFIGTSNSNFKEESSKLSNSIKLDKNSIKQKYFFKFILSSPLVRLSINSANRIFTDKNVVEVVKEIFKFYQSSLMKEIDFSNIKNLYETKEYIAQYNESDLEFLKRICFNNGIYFYEDESKIYFYDVPHSLDDERYDITTNDSDSSGKNIIFNPNVNNILSQECINSVNKTEILNSNSFSYSLQSSTYPVSLNLLNSQSIFDEARAYNTHAHLSQYSFTQHESLHIPTGLKKIRSILDLNRYEANSNVFGLKLNENISLNVDESDLKNDNSNFNFKIISLTQIFVDETNLKNRLDSNDITPIKGKTFSTTYSNQIVMLPKNIVFAPSFKSKPRAPEATFGVVIGSSDIDDEKNTIHTDQFGRVKVRINAFSTQESIDNIEFINGKATGNLKNTNDYSRSAYLRVITPIASNNSGFFAIPRIGDEVVVSFLENDIDKPIVSGSLYNSYNPPLPSLPTNYHQTTISSKTIGVNEGGRNEITLSNIKDKEQIYLKAEKDYDELVQHNFTQTIENNKSSKVIGTYTERIKQAHIQTIDLAKNVNVGAEYLTTVGLSRDTLVGLSNTLNVGVDNKIRVGKDSSEDVGNNKTIEIRGNLDRIIHQDETNIVKQAKRDIIEGSYEFNASQGINYYTKEHMVFQADNYTEIKSNGNLTIVTDSQHTEVAESKFSEIKTNYEMDAGNKIIHKVGSSEIYINGSSVIIKAGGVDVVIDSSGLTVMGGHIKAE